MFAVECSWPLTESTDGKEAGDAGSADVGGGWAERAIEIVPSLSVFENVEGSDDRKAANVRVVTLMRPTDGSQTHASLTLTILQPDSSWVMNGISITSSSRRQEIYANNDEYLGTTENAGRLPCKCGFTNVFTFQYASSLFTALLSVAGQRLKKITIKFVSLDGDHNQLELLRIRIAGKQLANEAQGEEASVDISAVRNMLNSMSTDIPKSAEALLSSIESGGMSNGGFNPISLLPMLSGLKLSNLGPVMSMGTKSREGMQSETPAVRRIDGDIPTKTVGLLSSDGVFNADMLKESILKEVDAKIAQLQEHIDKRFDRLEAHLAGLVEAMIVEREGEEEEENI
ncbi:hypothetical protein HDU67_000628 [Dinochytrium kinnereticum]|nr:hypothetical protein HDU67_000628 [Dinochytrium kinnereticum]